MATPAFAWYSFPYTQVGYSNGSYMANDSAYRADGGCSYWCMNWNGYDPVNYYGSLNAQNAPYYQSYVSPIGSTYAPENGYGSYWNNGYRSGDYYDYRSVRMPAQLQPYTNTYGAIVSSGSYMMGQGPYYVGPRGGSTYSTSGSYPYVSGTSYWGY